MNNKLKDESSVCSNFDGKDSRSETNSNVSYKRSSLLSSTENDSENKQFEKASKCYICTCKFDNLFYRKHHWFNYKLIIVDYAKEAYVVHAPVDKLQTLIESAIFAI